jgi:high-affinity nickel-transport protein
LWSAVDFLGKQIPTIGFAIVGVFIAGWGISATIYRLKRYDDLDVQTESTSS